MDSLETLAGAELNALLLCTLSHADKCALIRSRLSDVAGKPVRAGWLERPAPQDASTFSALTEDGEMWQGLCLPRLESGVWLLDLPSELLVNVFHRLGTQKDVVAVVNTCGTLRNITLQATLKTLTHIDESNRRDKHSACRMVPLLNVIGPCVESLRLDFWSHKEVEHQLTVKMPHLVSVDLRNPSAALLEQLVALAPLRFITLHDASISWMTLERLQHLPLEELFLEYCKVDAPADYSVTDARLAITLRKATLFDVVFSSSENPNQCPEWQCHFAVVSLFRSPSFRFAEQFFSRHLTHLHLTIQHRNASYVEVLPLFENAAFPLQQLRLSIADIACLEGVLPVVIRRNPKLEVLVVNCVGREPISSSAFNGIQRLTRLRFLGLWDVAIDHPEAVASWLSMPSFKFWALKYLTKVPPNLLASVESGLFWRMLEWHALIQLKDGIRRHVDYCSHLNFKERDASTCRVCKETVNAECCFRLSM